MEKVASSVSERASAQTAMMATHTSTLPATR